MFQKPHRVPANVTKQVDVKPGDYMQFGGQTVIFVPLDSKDPEGNYHVSQYADSKVYKLPSQGRKLDDVEIDKSFEKLQFPQVADYIKVLD